MSSVSAHDHVEFQESVVILEPLDLHIGIQALGHRQTDGGFKLGSEQQEAARYDRVAGCQYADTGLR